MREDPRDGLGRIDSALVTMAKAVKETMRQASTALLTADHSLAQLVAIRDAEIDVLHRLIDDRVFDLIARPRASDAEPLVILTALRVATEFDRMSELAVHVARSAMRRHPMPAVVPELHDLFRAMGMAADDLAGKVVLALTRRDRAVAAELDRDDDVMDQLHRQLFNVMVSPDWPLGVEAAIDGALLGRYYERYADHAVNVSQHVPVLVSGRTG